MPELSPLDVMRYIDSAIASLNGDIRHLQRLTRRLERVAMGLAVVATGYVVALVVLLAVGDVG